MRLVLLWNYFLGGFAPSPPAGPDAELFVFVAPIVRSLRESVELDKMLTPAVSIAASVTNAVAIHATVAAPVEMVRTWAVAVVER